MFNLYPVSLAMRARVFLGIVSVASIIIAYTGIKAEENLVDPLFFYLYILFLAAPVGGIFAPVAAYAFTKKIRAFEVVLFSLVSFAAIVSTVSGYYDPHPNAFLKAIAFLPHACWIAIFIIAKWAITGKVYRNSEQTSDIK